MNPIHYYKFSPKAIPPETSLKVSPQDSVAWKSSSDDSRCIVSPHTQCLPPVSVYEAGVDVVGPLQAPDWLQADARGLVGHDVDQPVLELVAGQVGADEARCVRLGVGQALEERREA